MNTSSSQVYSVKWEKIEDFEQRSANLIAVMYYIVAALI